MAGSAKPLTLTRPVDLNLIATVFFAAVLGASALVRAAEAEPPQLDPPQPGANWVSHTIGAEFVWIETLGVWVGKTELTNAAYRVLNPEHDSGQYQGHSLDGDRQPVVRVNLDDAIASGQRLTEGEADLLGGATYRVITVAEWTAVARCGEDRPYPWGDTFPPPSDAMGNYSDQTARETLGFRGIDGYDDGFAVTAPVDEVWENSWGLRGVGGNVRELAWRNRRDALLVGGSWFESGNIELKINEFLHHQYTNRTHFTGIRLVLEPASPE